MSLVVAFIPARFQSTRFPGKVLAPLVDGSMLEVVWRRVRQASRIDRVCIVTEDHRVLDAAQGFGAEAMTTSDRHPSGTDRIGEGLELLAGEGLVPDVILNVQADEPFVTPTCLNRLVDAFDADPELDIATLSEPIEDAETLFDPNVVKVVATPEGRALYFSRSPIPYVRGNATVLAADFRDQRTADHAELHRKHQGIYAFARTAFERFVAAAPSRLERAEGLEQLRALEMGMTLHVLPSDFRSVGVDTERDLERARTLMLEAR